MLIDQDDRHTVAVSRKELLITINVHPVQGEREVLPYLCGHTGDHSAEMAIAAGDDRDVDGIHGPRNRWVGRLSISQAVSAYQRLPVEAGRSLS